MSEPASPPAACAPICSFLPRYSTFFSRGRWPSSGAQGLQRPWSPLVGAGHLGLPAPAGLCGHGLLARPPDAPIGQQGLPRRAGWPRELGWAWPSAGPWRWSACCPWRSSAASRLRFRAGSAWGWLVVDVAFFALRRWLRRSPFAATASSALSDAVGPFGAALGFAAFYAMVQALMPGSSHASFAVSVRFSLLLSTAYLRTRALWVSWGLNFGWKASRALLFGLAVSGVSSHSPVVQGDPMGPFWLTGGGYGLDGSWIAFSFSFRAAGCLPHHARSRLPLQRSGHRPRRHSRGSGCRRPRPARGRHGACRARRSRFGADRDMPRRLSRTSGQPVQGIGSAILRAAVARRHIQADQGACFSRPSVPVALDFVCLSLLNRAMFCVMLVRSMGGSHDRRFLPQSASRLRPTQIAAINRLKPRRRALRW